MIWTIYSVILAYFILGFIGFYLINRKKERIDARKNWTKFGTYLIIIHILFFSIGFAPTLFEIIILLIIGGGFYEMYRVYMKARLNKKGFFLLALLFFALLSAGFYYFGRLNLQLVMFSFLIVAIFDSFSQISGQLWGKRRLFPQISPQKTLEGFIGGTVVAVASSILLSNLKIPAPYNPVALAAGIVVCAFLGDLAASYYKRIYKVKDFSKLIPGHGGVLDRFDSLISGGAFVALADILMN